MRWMLWSLLVAGLFSMLAHSAFVMMPSHASADDSAATEPAPIVCRLDALTEKERERSAALSQTFAAAVIEVRELANGYAFGLGDDPKAFVQLAEWITLERSCCPFFDFTLVWNRDGGAWLELSGADGVKAFIAAVMKVGGPSGE